jgi:site-specific recombinase XerD
VDVILRKIRGYKLYIDKMASAKLDLDKFNLTCMIVSNLKGEIWSSMSRPKLSLIRNSQVSPAIISFDEKLSDHTAILNGYIDTLYTRNFSPTTIKTVSGFLTGWFEGMIIPDSYHSDGERQLLIWEAMEPTRGRKFIVAFTKGLIFSGLKSRTVAQYLGYLRRLFQYVLDVPYIPSEEVQYIGPKYGPIVQPVLEYDYPTHIIDDEPEGYSLTLQELVDFYDYIRSIYIPRSQKKLAASRDYSMIVLAGETGLRADEIRGLDKGERIDLLFSHGRVQTRFGKGAKGSGKRTRKTIFTPLAQATTIHYLENIRPGFARAKEEEALYLSECGRRISYSAMIRNLKTIVEEARKDGLVMPPKLTWHDLRRSFATIFMERYPHLAWVLMDMLGHMNPSTLNRYIKHRRAFYDKAIDRVLDDLFEVVPA